MDMGRFLNIFESVLLSEGRVEKAKERYPDVDDDTFKFFVDNDPSGNQKYLDWMLGEYMNGVKVYGRADEILSLVKFFHDNNQRFEQKDINRYKSLTALIQASQIVKEKIKEKQEEKAVKKEKVVIYKDDRWLVVSPKSWKASCYYGAGTKWCITMKDRDQYWKRYTKRASFFFIIDKTKKENDPLYKVAYRKIGGRGKYELWDATDAEFSGLGKGEEYMESLPEEILIRAGIHHEKSFPKMKDGEYDDPRMQALYNYHGQDEEILETGDEHYGMPIFELSNGYWSVGTDGELTDALEMYYDDFGDEELSDYDYDGYYLRMVDEEGFIDEMAENYVYDLSEEEILEITGLDVHWQEIEDEIDELRDIDEDELYDMGMSPSDLKSKIEELELDQEGLVEDAKERMLENERDNWEICLSDGPVECLVRERGWYRNTSDLLSSGLVELDREGLIEELAGNSDWSTILYYGYDEEEDDEGNYWYVFEVDY